MGGWLRGLCLLHVRHANGECATLCITFAGTVSRNSYCFGRNVVGLVNVLRCLGVGVTDLIAVLLPPSVAGIVGYAMGSYLARQVDTTLGYHVCLL